MRKSILKKADGGQVRDGDKNHYSEPPVHTMPIPDKDHIHGPNDMGPGPYDRGGFWNHPNPAPEMNHDHGDDFIPGNGGRFHRGNQNPVIDNNSATQGVYTPRRYMGNALTPTSSPAYKKGGEVKKKAAKKARGVGVASRGIKVHKVY